MKHPEITKKVISTLSDEEILSILKTFNPNNPSEARNHTIFMLLLDTGLRIVEIVNLRVEDIHMNDGLKVLGKGRKECIVPIGYNAQKALQHYLFRYRPKLAHLEIDMVFLSIYGSPLTENSIKLMFARLAKRTGVHRLDAYLCWHTFTTRFLIHGGDMFTLQQILGHTTLDTVNHYLYLPVLRSLPNTINTLQWINLKILEKFIR